MLKSIQLQNLLSYGPDSPPLELRPLNVLIGANGSGKSNLIEAIGLLRAAPSNFSQPVKGIEGGGVTEWIWKGATSPVEAALEAIVENPLGEMPLRHRLVFAEHGKRFEIRDEAIENEMPHPNGTAVSIFYQFSKGHPRIISRKEGGDGTVVKELRREDLDPEQSILSQRKEPDQYPELYSLSERYRRIAIYSEWSFGRSSPQRLPQPADSRADFLNEKCDNLGLVLNRLDRAPKAKKRVLQALEHLYEGIEDFKFDIGPKTVQVFLQEGENVFPSTRLSDGTMRYLCLLAILCHPEPPPLVCIEEPELGLHPDAMPELARLLREASERCQLIVTTHSSALVDALTATPEDVVVCEKRDGSTVLERLDGTALADWLKDYSLGKLWRMGEIGGNRW